MDDGSRIELTLQLWGTGAPDALEEYITKLVGLLPRNRGRLERRVAEIDAGPAHPDVLLVVSFPDAASVDGFMRDPLRTDMEELAAAALSHSLVVDSHHRDQPDLDTVADVVAFPPDHDHHT
ncbi:MAG: hypothetical protein R2707_04420 [Acidimicrobiales bacterium]